MSVWRHPWRRDLALPAEVSDGFLIPRGRPLGLLADAVARARAGPSSDRPPLAIAYTWLAVEDDHARALQQLRPAVDAWLDGVMATAMYEAAGVGGRRGGGDPFSDYARFASAAIASTCS